MPHITFIHGILNKPPEERLINDWLRALARDGDGLDLDAEGVTYEMVYWADVLYATPETDGGEEARLERVQPEEISAVLPASWTAALSGPERVFVEKLAESLGCPGCLEAGAPPATGEPASPQAVHLERIPLPGPVKIYLMKVFLRDVHHYLYNALSEPRPGESYRVRDEIRRRFVDKLALGAARPGPHLVVSHSMGTVIAYDCLKRLNTCPAVDALVTLGSPLGLDEIQDVLGEDPPPKWTREDGYPHERVRGDWINIYDRLDPVVGFDPIFSNDFLFQGAERVKDIHQENRGWWRHSADKYLQGEAVQTTLERLLFGES